MDSERSHAYKRVLHTLSELGPSKLQSDEQERIRQAADTLIFSETLAGDEASMALADSLALCTTLVQSGRWQRATAERLAADIRACGPAAELALTVAAA